MQSDVMNKSKGTDLTTGERLKEILDEKGPAFTVPAFSQRIKMSESTLYRCITGKRPFKPQELERITIGLGISVQRFKQEDTLPLFGQLKSLIRLQINLHQAMTLAERIFPVAIGCSERFEITNCLGAIHYSRKKYKEAIGFWLESLAHAKKIQSIYSDSEPLKSTTFNLILAYTQTKDFSSLSSLLKDLEAKFSELSPIYAGDFCYAQATVAYEMGDLEEFEAKMLEQLAHYEKSGVVLSIAIALHNTADMFYKIRKYKQAKDMFERTLDYISQHEDVRKSEIEFICVKGYAKTLMKLRLRSEGLRIIEDTIQALESAHFPTLLAKFLLLHAIHNDTPTSAEAVLALSDVDKKLHGIANRLLMDYYYKIGDSEGLMRYYKIGDASWMSSISEMEEWL